MELLCKIRLGREIQPLLPAENYTINGIQVETVAAYNNSKPPHFKILKWLGYILTIGDTKVYISGDTDITNESKNVSCDIAILPIGGTYTVDPKQAAELAKAIAPHTVIPVHYGKLLGGEDAPEKFISAISDDIKVDVRPTVYSDILISMYTKTAILTGTAIILLLIIEKML